MNRSQIVESSPVAGELPLNDSRARDCAAIATQTLRKSERGRQALDDFGRLLDSGGHGLDSENWEALIALCRLVSRGKGFAVEEQRQHEAS